MAEEAKLAAEAKAAAEQLKKIFIKKMQNIVPKSCFFVTISSEMQILIFLIFLQWLSKFQKNRFRLKKEQEEKRKKEEAERMKELESQKKGLARQQTSNLDAKQLKRGSTKAGIFRSMTSNVSADKTDGSGGAKKEMSREKTDDSSSSSSSSDDSHAERERERQREAAARRGSIRRNSAEHILGLIFIFLAPKPPKSHRNSWFLLKIHSNSIFSSLEIPKKSF